MAPCESVSAPLAVGALTCGSFTAQCQLLHQRCVTHLRVVCCISGEGSTVFNKQVRSNSGGVGFCSTTSQGQPQTFQGIWQYSATCMVTLLVVPL